MTESVSLGNTEAPLKAVGMTGVRDMKKKSQVGWRLRVEGALNYAGQQPRPATLTRIYYGGWPGNIRTVKENASKTVEMVSNERSVCVCVCVCSVCVCVSTPPAPALEQQWRGDPAMVIMC